VFAPRKLFLLLAVLYALLVVYGSLVPFDFRAFPLEDALRRFAQIRYLQLGVESRADWVANILLYVPLAFLALGGLSSDRALLRALAAPLVLVTCVAISIAIEFTQQFFPPRTVSLNDLLAESMGSVLGILLWWASGGKVRLLVVSLLAKEKNATYAGLILYSVAYLAFSMFPYDFLISTEEIRAKLAGPFFHWLPSRSACGGSLRCGAKLAAEAAAVAPLGLLLVFAAVERSGALLRRAALFGFGLGLLIETLQLFLVSGATLGASVLTRVAGVVAGAAAGELLSRTSLWPLLYLLRPFMPLAGAVYVLLLALLVSTGKGPLLGAAQGLRRLTEIRFMPFYYHYYTTESAAMASLFGAASMFLPVGILFWIWRVTHMREFIGRGALGAAVWGGAVAVCLETLKLFLEAARPDPTNVLIGSLAAAAGFLGTSLCTRTSLNLVLPDANTPAHASD